MRVSPELPLQCLVGATSAIRDEGTWLHYLPAARLVACPASIVPFLERELSKTGWNVRCGAVRTGRTRAFSR
jgi:hypothetical protein